jgi:hypothetical protein
MMTWQAVEEPTRVPRGMKPRFGGAANLGRAATLADGVLLLH